MVPRKSSAEEVSFEWSHHRISSTDLKVRTTLRCRLTIQIESISQRKNSEAKSDEDDLQTLYARMYCLRRVSSRLWA